MSKVLFGPIITDARNKFAGLVFQKSFYGALIKKKTSPGATTTPASRSAKAVFSATAKSWAATLTQDQRNRWSALATANPTTNIFGNPQTLSGIAFFIRVNAFIKSLSAAHVLETPYTAPPQLLDAPSDQAHADPGILTASLTTTPSFSLTATITNVVGPSDQVVICASRPVSPGRKVPKAKSLAILVAFRPAESGPFDITAAYTAKHGTPPAVSAIALATYTIRPSNGAASPKYTFLALSPA